MPTLPRSLVSRSQGTVMDLFAGAGGFAEGLPTAGWTVSVGSDVWAAAAATYQANHEDHPFLEVDARDLTSDALRKASGGQPTAIVGGPPCQGFSSAGSRRSGDHRNTLVGMYALLAAEIRPEIVVFENVEGFLTAEAGRYVFDLLDVLLEAGYRVSLRKVNVANFGVPQLRKRVIAIAALGRDPIHVEPTHRAFGAPGAHRIGDNLPPTRTVGEALAGLPQPGTFEECGLTLHELTRIGDAEQRRVTFLAPGQKMRDLPPELQHASYQRRANRRVADGTATEKRGGAPAGVRRLSADEPSKAITGAASREFVHPVADRMLTLRECARLQTFPDEYVFRGTQTESATMIGNAVPPAFAAAIGRAMTSTLAEPRQQLPGRLVEFHVTNADAMSPALKKVVAAVTQRYGRFSSEPDQSTTQELLWS